VNQADVEPTGTVVGAEQGGLATDSGEDEVEDTPEVEDESEATAAPRFFTTDYTLESASPFRVTCTRRRFHGQVDHLRVADTRSGVGRSQRPISTTDDLGIPEQVHNIPAVASISFQDMIRLRAPTTLYLNCVLPAR
jgi:hypothetical protein